MELTVTSLRFLLSQVAMKTLMALLSLPFFPGMEEITQEEKEAGMAWLAGNSFLAWDEMEKPTIAPELAFMMTGVCQSPNALVWLEKGKTILIVCRFEGIYLLCEKMRVGKWMIAPFEEEDLLVKELDERLPQLGKAQLFRRAQMETMIQIEDSAKCLRLMHGNEEA